MTDSHLRKTDPLGVPKFARIPAHSWIGAWADRVIIVGFAVLLTLPCAASILGWNPYFLLRENRWLAPMPNFAIEPFAKWPGLAMPYFRDHFGLRSALIHANSVILHRWMKVDADNLVLGKDGWIFYRTSTEKNFENHLGLTPMTERELAFWKSRLEERQANAAALGCKYLFVIAPDKQSIYPEMLPDGWRPRGDTRATQFLAYLRDTHSRAQVLDLRPVLLNAKREGTVYFPQDTHWNGRGYFAAYVEISRRLKEWLPDLSTQRLGVDLGILRIASDEGDWDRVGLADENAKYPSDVLAPLTSLRAAQVALDLPPDVPNPAASWLAAVRTQNPGGHYRLLLLHDSFMSYGVQDRAEGPLTRDFAAMLSIGRELPDSSLMELEKSFHPDVVIEEMVERQIAGP